MSIDPAADRPAEPKSSSPRRARPRQPADSAGQRHHHRRASASSGSASRWSPDLLRLAPRRRGRDQRARAASQTQVRIRGAEANHTLLFVDGIRFNDPAAGNEPRFELLNADLAVADRGRARAAIGAVGVGSDRRRDRGRDGRSAAAHRLRRGSANMAASTAPPAGRSALGDAATSALVGGAGWQRSDGIDIVRRAAASATASTTCRAPAQARRLGRPSRRARRRPATGSTADSEYDGFDPVTFRRADTLDETEQPDRAPARLWARVEPATAGSAQRRGVLLDSANRNCLADAPLNRTRGDRLTLGGQVDAVRDRRSPPADRRRSSTRARISAPATQPFSAAPTRTASRSLTGARRRMAGRGRSRLIDRPRRPPRQLQPFADATTLRASLLVRPAGGFDAARVLWRGHRPAELLRSLRLLPRLVRRQSRRCRPERSRGCGSWRALARRRAVASALTCLSPAARATRSSTSSIRDLPLQHAPTRPARAADGRRGRAALAPCRLAAT